MKSETELAEVEEEMRAVLSRYELSAFEGYFVIYNLLLPLLKDPSIAALHVLNEVCQVPVRSNERESNGKGVVLTERTVICGCCQQKGFHAVHIGVHKAQCIERKWVCPDCSDDYHSKPKTV